MISYLISEITGNVSTRSHIYYVSNSIENDSGNNCLNAVSSASSVPQMSFLYSDYEDIGLKSDFFDITIINGSSYINNHYAVFLRHEELPEKMEDLSASPLMIVLLTPLSG